MKFEIEMISVLDYLPPVGGKYFIFDGKDFYTARMFRSLNGNEIYWSNGFYLTQPTHWAKLPPIEHLVKPETCQECLREALRIFNNGYPGSPIIKRMAKQLHEDYHCK